MPSERDFNEMIAYAAALAREGEGMADEVVRRRQADVLSALPGMEGRGRFLQAGGDVVRKFAGTPQRARAESMRVLEGDPEVDIEPIMNASQMAFSSGMPAAAKGAAGIFGGRLAANADRRALREAELRLQTGEDPRSVYRATGWFKDPVDGEMKFEISDALSTYKMPSHWDRIMLETKSKDALRGTTAPEQVREILPPMSQFFKHAELEKSYPGMLDDLRFGMLPRGISMKGGFAPESRTLFLAPDVDRRKGRLIGLHELEHGVQDKEGFPSGGLSSTSEIQPIAQEAAPRFQSKAGEFVRQISDDMDAYIARRTGEDPLLSSPYASNYNKLQRHKDLYDDYWRANPGLKEQYRDAMALMRDPDLALQKAQLSAYRRISGEVGARNVMDRADYSKTKRRDIPPWETMDRPPEGQIIIRPSQRVLPF